MEERIRVLYPSFCASFSAASRAIMLFPIIWLKTLSKTGSSFLGVSGMTPSMPFFRYLFIVSGISSSLYFNMMFHASLKALLSGTKGPDAITSILSPTTSESMRLMVVAGKADRAICPPFVCERCFLMQLMSSMPAPQSSSFCVISCFSSRDILPAGWGSSAEPPPEISEKTISCSPASSSIFLILFAPETPFLSGNGCPASIVSVYDSFSVKPYFTTIRPFVILSPSKSSIAAAMGAVALPPPTRKILSYFSRSSSITGLSKVPADTFFPSILTFLFTAT